MIREVVDVRELGSRLSELLTLVAAGNEVTVVKDEKPVARLLPPELGSVERVPGLHRGETWMSDDFDEPLPEAFWTGEE
jgi:antitoxin (DNA-binding transcriptional repressor) of toxin-antitoxin stability system